MKTFALIMCACVVSFTSGASQVLETGQNLTVNEIVSGGPKSGVSRSSAGTQVAEKATNRAHTVESKDMEKLSEGLKDPYKAIFGESELLRVWDVKST